MKVTFDQTYPMSLLDMSSIVRAAKAADPEVIMLFTYPQHSTAIIRAVGEIGFGPSLKLAGGGMVGFQFAPMLTSLGSALNGFVTFHFYVPEPTLDSGAMSEFLKGYQQVAVKQGVDALGFYIPTFAYARLQVLEAAITATKSIDDTALADHIRKTTFDTVVGKVRFGQNGERADGNAIFVQYQGITGDDLEQFKRPGRQVIVAPKSVASGKLITPFAAARK
jgi:branched-chain amino acid transport system substrate-binding protein